MFWQPTPQPTQHPEWFNAIISVIGVLLTVATIIGSQWNQFQQLKNDNQQIKKDLSEIKSEIYPRREAELSDRLYTERIESIEEKIERIDSD